MVGYVCRVCYKFGEIADSRRSSRKAIDTAIFVALLTGLGLCEKERVKNFYSELRQRRRYICMQHFHEAAQSLYDEVIATRGSFPEITSLSPKADTETCARTRPYDNAFSAVTLGGIRKVVEQLDKTMKIDQAELIMFVSRAKEKGYIRDTSYDSESTEPVKRLKWKDSDEKPSLLRKYLFSMNELFVNSIHVLPTREDSKKSIELTVPKGKTSVHTSPPPKKPRTASPLPAHEKPFCYAVIPITSNDVKEKLAFCLMDNGFDGMLFFSDLRDHPSVKPYIVGARPDNEQREDEQAFTSLPSSSPDATERVPSTLLFEVKSEERKDSTTSESITFMTSEDAQIDGTMDVLSSSYSDSASNTDSEESFPSMCSVKRESEDCKEISAADLMEKAVDTELPSTSYVDHEGYVMPRSSNSSRVAAGQRRTVKRRATTPAIRPPSRRIIRDQTCALDTLSDHQFRQRFRMSRKTFARICSKFDEYKSAIEIGAMLEILAGYDYSVLDPSLKNSRSELWPTFPPPFDDVLKDLGRLSKRMIYWPNDTQRQHISTRFREMTGFDNIVGCIDGTTVWVEPVEDPLKRKSLSMQFIADHNGRFRWVLPKLGDNIDHNTIFRCSSLFERFCNGTKKGILVGDDSYMHTSFLVTPSHLLSRRDTDNNVVKAVVEAHLLVDTAIRHLKKQFPILDGTLKMHSALVGYVVVLCTALYNATKHLGTPCCRRATVR
ncbi:hypothetical protein GCK32_006046 [Trichostrongylus colubriformis]|uniref:DDE Tnp4 domain-containing protein n=1 Tax=Trichostrongylus colubriformis TaxID=6319 RepID=A0AAN8IK11_TRICO